MHIQQTVHTQPDSPGSSSLPVTFSFLPGSNLCSYGNTLCKTSERKIDCDAFLSRTMKGTMCLQEELVSLPTEHSGIQLALGSCGGTGASRANIVLGRLEPCNLLDPQSQEHVPLGPPLTVAHRCNILQRSPWVSVERLAVNSLIWVLFKFSCPVS